MLRKLLYRPEALIALVSLWLMLTCDAAYWAVVSGSSSPTAAHSLIYYLAISMVTFGLTATLLLLLAVGPATRFVLALLLVIASAVGYFNANYGILFDENMLVNVFETNPAEAMELVSLPLIITVLLFGLLPALVVTRYPLLKRRFPAATLQRTLALFLAIGIAGGGMFLQDKEIISLARNHREVRYLMSPLNIISAAYAYSKDELQTVPEFEHLALDAVKIVPVAGSKRPKVQVIIVGETARAANFSLGGYARDTNPRLAARPLIYFSQTESCGTATAESLPCMFSLQGRADFDRERSAFQDNLLDIAARAGYRVLWLDNGNSCKKVCARVESRDLHLSNIAGLCRDNECFDAVLIRELESVLADVTQDTLIVLHQMGSHGPAYSLRRPDKFKVFGPECTASDLGECSQTEITNAYDNTILYTDHVIDQAISALEARNDELDTGLIYVSDHGESLGEHGLYLHGMPYRLAPSEQTHVPMLAWFSAGFQQRAGFTDSCTQQLAGAPVSHDYLFHTTLALLDIRTAVYQPGLDLFAACRPHNRIGTAHSTTTAAL